MEATQQHIKDVIDLILATRDFCGDEGHALTNYIEDTGVEFTAPQYGQIHAGVETKWDESRRAAREAARRE